MSNYLRHVHTLFTKLFKLVKYAHATWTSPDETNSLRRHFFLTEAVKSVIKQTVLIISNTRYRAASGGPRSPFGFDEAFKEARGIQGGKFFK